MTLCCYISALLSALTQGGGLGGGGGMGGGGLGGGPGGGGSGSSSKEDDETREITIPNEVVGRVIGRGGQKINEIRLVSFHLSTYDSEFMLKSY